MSKNNEPEPTKTLEEIEEEIKESEPENIEAYSKIGDDSKSLFIRIPAIIRSTFDVKKGQYMKFYAEIKDKKVGDLEITIEDDKPQQ